MDGLAVSQQTLAAPQTPRAPPRALAAPQALALPDLHELILAVFKRHIPPAGQAVLELGAGRGAMSARLRHAGYRVRACDLFPDLFECPEIECRRADLHEPLPYDHGEFDVVAAIEVVEHLESQRTLFGEVARVLRPGGKFVFSTPNVASLKSRLGFLFTGYLYSHGPLDPAVFDPVSQHIAPFTPDRYRFALGQAGLELTVLEADKYQRSSLWLAWLVPWIRLRTRLRYAATPGTALQNCPAALFGRTLIGIAQKPLRG